MGSIPIQTLAMSGIASWKVRIIVLKLSVLARYFVIEDQVQKAPHPMKTSLYLSVNLLLRRKVIEPKIVKRFPHIDTMYQSLNSLTFSVKLRLFQESYRFS